MNRNNIAARMGRWSATHWKTATFGWLAFVVVAFGIGGMVGMKTIDADAPGPGESGRMDRILDAGFPQPAGESVLVQSSTLRTSDPRVQGRRRTTSSRRSRSSTPSSTSARRSLPRTAGRSPRTGTRPSSGSRSAATRTRRSTGSARSSTASTSCRRRTRSSSSGVRRREQGRRARQPRTGTTSARPGCCRSRSRWSSSWSPSARSWQPGSRCCSR